MCQESIHQLPSFVQCFSHLVQEKCPLGSMHSMLGSWHPPDHCSNHGSSVSCLQQAGGSLTKTQPERQSHYLGIYINATEISSPKID